MTDKCNGCIFAEDDMSITVTIPICTREEDYIESVNARLDTEICPWYISKQKIIELQNNRLI